MREAGFATRLRSCGRVARVSRFRPPESVQLGFASKLSSPSRPGCPRPDASPVRTSRPVPERVRAPGKKVGRGRRPATTGGPSTRLPSLDSPEETVGRTPAGPPAGPFRVRSTTTATWRGPQGRSEGVDSRPSPKQPRQAPAAGPRPRAPPGRMSISKPFPATSRRMASPLEGRGAIPSHDMDHPNGYFPTRTGARLVVKRCCGASRG